MRESQAETARHTPLLSARKDTIKLSKEGSKAVKRGFKGGSKWVHRGFKEGSKRVQSQ